MNDYEHAHCCDRMRDQVEFTCDAHPDRFDCPDALIDYYPSSHRYGIMIHDGGSSMEKIDFCPWCGTKLPEQDDDDDDSDS